MFQNYMRRLFWLILGVAVSSIGIAMMLQANVGLEPWSVLQQGMSLRTGMTYGTASAMAAILTAVLFGESFGFGTIINIAGCAVMIDAIQAAHLIPQMHGLVSGIAMLIGGLELLFLLLLGEIPAVGALYSSLGLEIFAGIPFFTGFTLKTTLLLCHVGIGWSRSRVSSGGLPARAAQSWMCS